MNGIRMQGISKKFGNLDALKDIDLFIKEGTIHAIVGENGAGKSTLMNILSGVTLPTTGEIFLNGSAITLAEPKDASRLGIGMVHQHFMLIPNLTVWQNAFLGIEPLQKFRKINKKQAVTRIIEACSDFSMSMDPHQVVGTLTVGEQQRVEIMKVLIREAHYIIFDEPTAVLTPQEIEQLFINIRSLKNQGKTIIFISHKLEEVFDIADEITVLRQGQLVATLPTSDVTPAGLIDLMVGRSVNLDGYPLHVNVGPSVLKVDALSTARSLYSQGLNGISLTVHRGEVLGIAGVDGNGQHEFIDAILGIEHVVSGDVFKDGTRITNRNPAQIRKSGISVIPPDRQKQGLVMNNTILANAILGCENHQKVANGSHIDIKRTRALVNELANAYDVRMPSIDAEVRELSGGNQQKTILAREFGVRDSNLVIAVNPTRGLDIGAIEFVYQQIEKQKAEGAAIILISTELSEIMRLSDRIAVFFKGQCVGVVNRDEANTDNIGHLMMGVCKYDSRTQA